MFWVTNIVSSTWKCCVNINVNMISGLAHNISLLFDFHRI